jgi:ATP-binding cassette subfamily F protein 3
MALLSANKLAKYFGIDDIFSEVTLNIYQGERVGLVGPNGCGKSTLLDILAGVMEPDAGTVSRARYAQIGYLPQTPDFDGEATLWEEMDAVFAELHARQAELRRLEAQMGSDDEAAREKAMQRYGPLLEAFERDGGFTYESRIAQVLNGLGFSEAMFSMPIQHLSGGEKTRALLARLLLEEPDLLLLDEPTNHLDLAGIEWLEDRLQAWDGAILAVAHDRAFLDAIADRIFELEFGSLEAYRGNYTAYRQQRAERRERQRAQYEAQQAHIAKTEDYIQRYMAGQRSSQAKGRLRRLERLERLDRPQEHQQIHVNLQTQLRSGDLVLGLYDLHAGYEPGVPLLCIEEAEIRRGQRVALVGPNGSGKTTLLRTILRDIPPLAGRVRVGAAVRLGYFAQAQEHLVPGKTVLDTLLDAGMDSVAKTRDFLARYGFRGDDVFKDVGVLSGGERARVALATLSLAQANFLLLDEPTNHLDIPSQEVLQEVIRGFNGTVLMVSHDRYLIREIATHVWALADGEIHQFAEGYAEYAAWHGARRHGNSAAATAAEDEARARYEAQRQAQREQQRALAHQEARLEELETEIHALESRLQELTGALDIAGREQDIGRVSKLGAEYRRVEGRLNRMLEAWMEASEAAAV